MVLQKIVNSICISNDIRSIEVFVDKELVRIWTNENLATINKVEHSMLRLTNDL